MNKATKILSQVVLIFLAVIVIYPLVFVFLTSVKSNYDVLDRKSVV